MTTPAKPVFVAEDFLNKKEGAHPLDGLILFAQDAAEIANARLAEIAKDWPVVYGHPVSISSNAADHTWTTIPTTTKAPTHTARLAFVQPIERKEEENARCKTCGNPIHGKD